MQITEEKETDKIILIIAGRIDANTSPDLQQKILINFQKMNHLVLDLAQVDYISSAGLRALLIGQKTAQSKKGSMKLIHVVNRVYDVLRMARFDKILDIDLS